MWVTQLRVLVTGRVYCINWENPNKMNTTNTLHEGNTLNIQLVDYMPLLDEFIFIASNQVFKITKGKITGWNEREDYELIMLEQAITCKRSANYIIEENFEESCAQDFKEIEEYLPRPDNIPEWAEYMRVVHEGHEIFSVQL